MRVSLPCVHEGAELNWDGISHAVHFQDRTTWRRCNSPDLPLGPNVCARIGCNPTCSGYEPGESKEYIPGIAPLSVQRIKLPHPGAFNASMIRYNGQLLMAYRDKQMHSRLYIAHMDENRQPTRIDGPLELEHERCILSQEDPRLFVHQDRLHLSFIGVNPWEEHAYGIRANVMYARLTDDLEVDGVWYPEYESRSAWEKNWSFFSHDGRLYCVYSIKPHHIFEIEGNQIVRQYTTDNILPWSGGHLRGGAPPVLVGDSYYHWFHGRVGAYHDTTYNTGVYSFEARPPFRVQRMTPHPVQWADKETRAGKTASVVFVAGAILEDDKWTLTQGIHDMAIDVATFDAGSIEKNLTNPATIVKPKIPPVYVLYCEEIPDRKERIARHLKEHGIEAHFWRSVHGKSWGLATTKVYVQGESPINAGQAGLVMGHYMLWQHLEAIGVEDAIILEDDAILCSGFHDRMAEVLRDLPQDADMCYIGHLGCNDRIKERLVGGICSLTFIPWATHAIYYRKRAFPILLKLMAEIRDPVDSQLWHNVLKPADSGFQNLRWYACEPSIVSQESASGLCPTTLHGFDAWQIHPEPLRTELKDCLNIPGWCVETKQRLISNLVHREKAKVVVELGVFGGASLIPMAMALRQCERDCDHRDPTGMVWGIDPWNAKIAGDAYLKEGDTQNGDWWSKAPLEQIYTDLCNRIGRWSLWPYVNLIKGTSDRAADLFLANSIDILHIDGSHDPVSSLADVRRWMPLVKVGGYIIFDDASWSTTKAALRELECQGRLIIDDPAMGGGVRIYRKV